MEVTALCFRLLMLEFILLGTQVQDSYTQCEEHFLRVTPNRLQHFQSQSVSFECVEFDDSTKLRVIKNTQESDPACVMKRTSTESFCTIERAYPGDSGEYWCETKGGQRSNSVNITVTAGPLILESPVLPVMEGNDVTLHCRQKTSFNLTAHFYKDGVILGTSSMAQLAIHSISKSDEGLYKCSISGVGASPESWLAVRALALILDSPVLPVMEGSNVTLRCRRKTISLNCTADFYKDGLLMGSSSTGQMIIHNVSKSDEGLYKCNISDGGESPENWLAVRAPHRDTCPSSDHFLYVLLLLRTVFTIVMVPLLLLLVGLLHCGKLPVTHK